MNFSFARRHRLTKTDEYSSVFGFRRAIRGQWLMLHFQPRPAGFDSARLGLVVGKKLLKRAVDRNRVKRIVREQFRLRRADLPAYDLVVRLHARPQVPAGQALAADFLHLLGRLRRPGGKREEK
ncbi:MAG: ribonuclease P protein component [Azonexus sp.]|nr:ribonuclease P protein component [Azonexus sp.]MCK6412202.1 ribonuclease P protein component [Azonexus sp.]